MNKSIHIFIAGTLLKLPSNGWPRDVANSSAAGQTEYQATGFTLDRQGDSPSRLPVCSAQCCTVKIKALLNPFVIHTSNVV